MTTKEALHERIDELTDEEAEELLAQLEWEATAEEELTPEEMALLEEGNAEFERGEFIRADDLYRELGL
ncbi:MAG TPA: hypothetical protein VJQ83_02115 [Tepidiformaceae bacterium]|nr:hypothetical protein [Tepidiformaceae bacterium]